MRTFKNTHIMVPLNISSSSYNNAFLLDIPNITKLSITCWFPQKLISLFLLFVESYQTPIFLHLSMCDFPGRAYTLFLLLLECYKLPISLRWSTFWMLQITYISIFCPSSVKTGRARRLLAALMLGKLCGSLQRETGDGMNSARSLHVWPFTYFLTLFGWPLFSIVLFLRTALSAWRRGGHHGCLQLLCLAVHAHFYYQDTARIDDMIVLKSMAI
jgi:hypothetical protein